MWIKVADDNPAFWRKRSTRENLVLRDSYEKDFARILPVAVIDAPNASVGVLACVWIGDAHALVDEKTVAPRLSVIIGKKRRHVYALTPFRLVGQRNFMVHEQKPSRWQTADEEP